VEAPPIDLAKLAKAEPDHDAPLVVKEGGGLSPMVWGTGLILITLAFLFWQWT
jgi:hypothetical protein